MAALLASSIAASAGAQEGPRAGEGAVPSGQGGAVVKDAPPEAPAPAGQIVMPTLKKFVQAKYPPEAEAAGLQAVVGLRLDIDRTGKVTHAEVAEPAGHSRSPCAFFSRIGSR